MLYSLIVQKFILPFSSPSLHYDHITLPDAVLGKAQFRVKHPGAPFSFYGKLPTRLLPVSIHYFNTIVLIV